MPQASPVDWEKLKGGRRGGNAYSHKESSSRRQNSEAEGNGMMAIQKASSRQAYTRTCACTHQWGGRRPSGFQMLVRLQAPPISGICLNFLIHHNLPLKLQKAMRWSLLAKQRGGSFTPSQLTSPFCYLSSNTALLCHCLCQSWCYTRQSKNHAMLIEFNYKTL